MTAKQKTHWSAGRHGARIEISTSADGLTYIEAIVPEGLQWSEGPQSLVAVYGCGIKAHEAWEELTDRMTGTEPHTE